MGVAKEGKSNVGGKLSDGVKEGEESLDFGSELGRGKRGERGDDGGDVGGICVGAYGAEEVADNTDMSAGTDVRDVAWYVHGAQENCECGFAEIKVEANEMNGISDNEEALKENAEVIVKEVCVIMNENACEVGRKAGHGVEEGSPGKVKEEARESVTLDNSIVCIKLRYNVPIFVKEVHGVSVGVDKMRMDKDGLEGGMGVQDREEVAAINVVVGTADVSTDGMLACASGVSERVCGDCWSITHGAKLCVPGHEGNDVAYRLFDHLQGGD